MQKLFCSGSSWSCGFSVISCWSGWSEDLGGCYSLQRNVSKAVEWCFSPLAEVSPEADLCHEHLHRQHARDIPRQIIPASVVLCINSCPSCGKPRLFEHVSCRTGSFSIETAIRRHFDTKAGGWKQNRSGREWRQGTEEHIAQSCSAGNRSGSRLRQRRGSCTPWSNRSNCQVSLKGENSCPARLRHLLR